MEINLLVLNIGNTRLGIASFVAGELRRSTRISLDNRANLPGAITQAWEELSGRENAAVAAISVNPTVNEHIEHLVNQVTGAEIEWVGSNLKAPIRVLTEQPADTGMDRVVNVAAAYEQMQKACVVVDAGTAITIDCCNDNGDFLGGAIAPGVQMMLSAMHEKTAKLPAVPFKVPEHAFGKSTQEAMLQGVYHGIRGMVKELVENYATELGHWPEIIATGGDAEKLFENWELIHAISPDLTFYGIALAYANDHIKHGT